MIIGQRLEELMSARRLSQSELARRIGISQSAIAHLVAGRSAGSKHISAIARELATTPEYLTGDIDDADAGARPAPSQREVAEHLDLVPITSIDMAYGMGATFADQPVAVDVLHFPKVWIESITDSPPALLTWARGRGDSMWPTIGDGEMVLIDRSDREVKDQDAIWAFTVGDMGMMKRLRIRNGKAIILSDNERVPPDHAELDEMNIVGRVAYVVRRV